MTSRRQTLSAGRRGSSLPSPGLFSALTKSGSGVKAQTSRPPISSILCSKQKAREIKSRSDGYGEKRYAKVQEKNRLHKERMSRKSSLVEVSAEVPRSRQVS